ncbi:MAG: FMN-binding glutamate synthase family protein [Vampirovibrio sp.]|nr:FMN-binding glutamate synthase family protein [Vampirovibrio sp.]
MSLLPEKTEHMGSDGTVLKSGNRSSVLARSGYWSNRPVFEKTLLRDTTSYQSRPKPISEEIWNLITRRSDGLKDLEVLGSATDVYAVGYESLIPAYVNPEIKNTAYRVTIGSKKCKKPYEASIFNCSALSYGPLSKNFIMAINKAASKGEFYQNTGEAGISPYHFGIDLDIEDPDFEIDRFIEDLSEIPIDMLPQIGDIVWEIGNGYFGCRTKTGEFDPVKFQKIAQLPYVKMIEVKISQGMAPNKDLPMPSLTTGFAKILNVDLDTRVKLSPGHSEFSTPKELVEFIDKLRTLSGGKPVGIKMSLGRKHEFLAICKAMVKLGLPIDFITLDGMEAGTSGSARGVAGFCGVALDDAIVYVHNVLSGLNIREQVKIIASGRVFTEREIILKLARGADICATARGIMVAAGCEQQRDCYKGTCAKGIATQDKTLQNRLDPFLTAERIYSYHEITMREVTELLSIAGLTHPSQLRPHHVYKRISYTEAVPLDNVYDYIKPGQLMSKINWRLPKQYRKDWFRADIHTAF